MAVVFGQHWLRRTTRCDESRQEPPRRLGSPAGGTFGRMAHSIVGLWGLEINEWRSARGGPHGRAPIVTAVPTSFVVPPPSSPEAQATMRENRGRDTRPELAIRRALHGRGWRYRVDRAPLAGLRCRADIVFASRRVAVFVDGCFWHGCVEHLKTPNTHRHYWAPKIATTSLGTCETTRRCRRPAGR